MTYEIPTNEPQELVAGDRWQWTRDLSDYPASTWTVTYYFHPLASTGTVVSFAASADGETHSVDVPKGTTENYAAGEYEWHALANDGTTRRRVDSGTLKIVADLSLTHVDSRSHWRTVLDNIEPIIQGRASKDQSSYSISGRQLSRMSWEELQGIYNRAKAEVVKEERRDRAKNGLGHRGRVLVGFK
jgi:hypothetical protein